MLGILSRYHWLRLARYAGTRTGAKAITALLFLTVMGGVAFGIFRFFLAGFALITRDPVLRTALPLYIYELFLLIVAYLVFVSALISGSFALFRGREDNWVMASPKFKILYSYGYFRVFFSSLWPFLVIALPALVAILSIFHFGFWVFVLVLFSMTVFFGFIVLVALLLLMAAAELLRLACRLCRPGSRISFWQLAVCVFLVLVFVSYGIWQRITVLPLEDLFVVSNYRAAAVDIGIIVAQFKIFPSHLLSLVLLAAQNGDLAAGVWPTLDLVLLTLAAVFFFWLFSKSYLPLWQNFQESGYEARPRKSGPKAGVSPFPWYLKSPVGVLFEKEFLVTFRNAKNILWLGFLMLIWMNQILLDVFLRNNIARHGLQIGLVGQTLEAAATIFFVSAFALRFAFLAFSTERRTAWIIASAPLDLGKVFLTKFLFFTANFLVLGLIIGFVNAAILGIPLSLGWSALTFSFIAVVFLSVFSLGIGALFPNFDTDDPQVLSTSLPGLTFTFGALCYDGLGTLLLYLAFISGTIWPIIVFEVLSALAIGLMLWLIPKALRKFEFVKTLR